MEYGPSNTREWIQSLSVLYRRGCLEIKTEEVLETLSSFDDLAPREQIEVMVLQIGILEDYIQDHQKKIAQAVISQAKIEEYRSQILKLRKQITQLKHG